MVEVPVWLVIAVPSVLGGLVVGLASAFLSQGEWHKVLEERIDARHRECERAWKECNTMGERAVEWERMYHALVQRVQAAVIEPESEGDE